MIRSIEYARAHRHVLEERQRIQQAQNLHLLEAEEEARLCGSCNNTSAPSAVVFQDAG